MGNPKWGSPVRRSRLSTPTGIDEGIGRWLCRALFLAGLGLALWLVGTATASADDSVPEHGVGVPPGAADVWAGPAATSPLELAAAVAPPTLGSGGAGTVPTAAGLARPEAEVLSATADTAETTGNGSVDPAVRKVHAVTETLPVHLSVVPVDLSALTGGLPPDHLAATGLLEDAGPAGHVSTPEAGSSFTAVAVPSMGGDGQSDSSAALSSG